MAERGVMPWVLGGGVLVVVGAVGWQLLTAEADPRDQVGRTDVDRAALVEGLRRGERPVAVQRPVPADPSALRGAEAKARAWAEIVATLEEADAQALRSRLIGAGYDPRIIASALLRHHAGDPDTAYADARRLAVDLALPELRRALHALVLNERDTFDELLGR